MASALMIPTEHAWERQANESSAAYTRFLAYRDLGADRSLRKVASISGISQTLCERWCSKYHWVARARKYDAWLVELGDAVNKHAVLRHRVALSRAADLAIAASTRAMPRIRLLTSQDVSTLINTGIKAGEIAYGPRVDRPSDNHSVNVGVGVNFGQGAPAWTSKELPAVRLLDAPTDAMVTDANARGTLPISNTCDVAGKVLDGVGAAPQQMGQTKNRVALPGRQSLREAVIKAPKRVDNE